jgi:amino acid adenylation domain-containing protein
MNRDSSKDVGFSEQKLALLASLLGEEGTQAEERRGITRRENQDEYPLSAGQQRMWFLDQLEQGVHYNENFNLRLKGAVDIAILERTLQEILRRHEAMRASFMVRDGQPVQRIVPAEPFGLPVINLRGIPELDRQGEAVRLAVEEARRPFDLAKGPLWRFALLLLAEDECILLITAHHIATDGWSFGVFLKELRLLYEACRAGEPSPLSDPVLQYADYAAWQIAWLDSEAAQQQLSYWTRHLSAAPPLLELPTDHPRPSILTFRGARHNLTLSKPLTAALRDLSQHRGVTLFMTLLAAFQALLSRYTGRDDIVVGTPIANRTVPESEGLIGYFVNTLVLRSDLSGDPTFVDLLQQVRRTTLGGFENQDLPLEKLVDALRPQRTESYAPLFQVLFILQNVKAKWEFPQLSVSPFRIDNGTAKFDLTLCLLDRADGLAGWIEYATDLFDAARIGKMAGHFLDMLEGIVSNPNEHLSRLPLLTEAEMQQLLVDWNDTQVDYPAKACIHELFEAQAQRTPEAVALAGPSLTQASGSQVSWTYAELNQRANELANYLQALGVGPGVLAAVCMERTVEMVVGLLAVLKAGGAYVPLDPAYPPERLAFILEETQVPVVLTQQSIAAFLPSYQARVVCLDDPNLQVEIQKLAGDGFRSSSNPQDPSHLAYVLYTSGSTGKPKGVEICHRAVVNFLNSMREMPGMEGQDTLLLVTTLSFDIFGLELWLPLTTGAKVVIAPEEVTRDGRELAALMRRSGATVMQATPSTWRLLLESGWEGNPQLKILCGGEAWPPQLAEQLLPKCASLWNMYGPTETTIWSAVHAVGKGKPVLIGRPIANTQFYVVDSHLQPVPVGVPGELLIGGEGLARGYWNRPELTAEKFIADPFSTDAESRLYRTGDLVRYLADGTLEFLGRIDHQVKIRGFRIELGEIESVLRAHSAVSDAVVIVREDGGNQRLVAYIVPSEESDSRPAEWRDYLKTKLPDYMVPTLYVMLEKLPLTPNGKVDRKALPLPGHTTIQTQADSGVPRDMLEQQLTRLWERILGVRHIGLSDDFFDLGGHSFLALQLFSEIERLTGRRLPLATLFRASTVRQLADVLRKDGWSPHWSSLVPINPGGSQLPLYLVHGAEGNVLLYRQLARYLGPDQPVYGFQSKGLDGNGSLRATIEEMASDYIKELEAFQPSGPYRLGGYCLGGAVALEMAHQLQAKGEQVELVAMLETYNNNALPPSRRRRTWRLVHSLQNLWFHGANFCFVKNKDRWKFIREKWDVEMTRLGIRLRALSPARYVSGREETQSSYPHLRVKKVNDLAVRRYVPRTYSGRVVVIRPKGNFWGLDRVTFGWGDVVRDGLEVREIPIYPKGMLVEPFVQTLAEELRACLGEAE